MTQPHTLPDDAVSMTQAEWQKVHRDLKTMIDGQRYVLRSTARGTCFVLVIITKEKTR